jgi:hypothetical protein
MKDLFEEDSTPPAEYFTDEQKTNWYKKFVEYANKEYSEYGESYGRFCCGCDWCCDRCQMEKMEACEDCVDTIINILEENNVLIDYLDFDFEKWEKIAKEKLKG